MGDFIFAYIIGYSLIVIFISILYYKCIRNVFLKGNELRTINSLGITFATAVIVVFLKTLLEFEIIRIDYFDPLYLEVLVILIAVIKSITREIKEGRSN